jgi:hypothetical protein
MELLGDFASGLVPVEEHPDHVVFAPCARASRSGEIDAVYDPGLRNVRPRGEWREMIAELVQADRRWRVLWLLVSDAAPLIAREWVVTALVIEYRENAVLCIRFEAGSAGSVEAIYRLDQADGACADEIIHQDAAWYPCVYSPGYGMHLFHISENGALAAD